MVIVTAGDGAWLKQRDDMGRIVSKRRDLTPKRVLRVLPNAGKDGGDMVVVEGVNIVKRHRKPTQQDPQGGIREMEKPIHASNVSPAAEGRPTRVRFQTRSDGSKVRLAARNGQQLGPELRKARA